MVFATLCLDVWFACLSLHACTHLICCRHIVFWWENMEDGTFFLIDERICIDSYQKVKLGVFGFEFNDIFDKFADLFLIFLWFWTQMGWY